MKNYKLVSTIFCFIISFYSCSNDEIENKNLESTNENPIETGILSFSYKGNHYESQYHVIDSTMIFSDEKTSKIVEELKKNPNVAIYVGENQGIEYFDSLEELDNKHFNNKDVENLDTRAGGRNVVTLDLYKHLNFTGPSLHYTISSDGTKELKEHMSKKWNDEVTSFKLTLIDKKDSPIASWRGSITFYEHKNFGGISLSYAVGVYKGKISSPEISVKNLKSIVLPWDTRKHWNDRMTSFWLRFD